MNDLTVSNIERQNVLNNKYAVAKIQDNLGITGMEFEGEYRFTKKMVADFYEVDERTIERYIEQYADELSYNGYVLCKGKRLKELKLQFAPVINVGSKTTQLGLFNFRAFLNIGMLLTESEKAKQVRSIILDSPDTCTTPSLHVAYPQQGDEAGDNGPEMAVGARIQISAEREERVGQAGYSDAQIQNGDFRQRLFLART